MKLLVLVLAVLAAMTGCSGGGIAFKFSVVIDPRDIEKFLDALIAAAPRDSAPWRRESSVNSSSVMSTH